MYLWENKEKNTKITYYPSAERSTDGTVIIFPGGGYQGLANHEGKGYADFLSENGIDSFVVEYRVSPDRFPLPILDARRAVSFVRANAGSFGINPHRIAVMGSSAGGHLAAMLSTYREPISGENEDETDRADYMPDAQILCYPVIVEPGKGYSHDGSYINLLGKENMAFAHNVDPSENVTPSTPPAFIWHTAEDDCVNVKNSYTYASALRDNDVPVEMHIFPFGNHGMGLASGDPNVSQWTGLLVNWFRVMGWIER